MIKRVLSLSLFLLMALGCGAPLAAASETSQITSGAYALDKNHASLLFRINHLGFSLFHGRFDSFDARLRFDAKEPEKSVVEATIDVKSIDTNNSKLEEELRGEKFFNTDKFPTATFKSIHVTRSGDSGTMIGQLTLMGVTKPVTLNVTFHGGGIHPMSKKPVVGFGARGAFNRSQWGINYGIPNVGDEVSIEIEGEFQKTDESSAMVPAKETEKPAAPAKAAEPAQAAEPTKVKEDKKAK